MALNPSTGWQWYKKLNISNSSADYQMKLKLYPGEGTDNPTNGEVYCNKHCKNFPDDIRFGTTNDPSTATQLPQWLEEYEEAGLQDITYDSTIFSGASQGVAMDDEWFYGISSSFIAATKIASGKSIKTAFQYDASTDSYTDYTDEINNYTSNDVDLLPSTPSVGDAFYFGLYNKFTGIAIRIETAGSDITITWKYWNGSSWTNLPNVVDNTNSFTTSGGNYIYWDRPTDWQQNTVNGVTAYWIKAEVTSVGSNPTQPKASYAYSGKYTGNDGSYTDHLSDGHVLSHGGSNYLYVAGSSYPDTPKTGAVYKYKTAKDSNNPLDFIGVVKDFSSESCPGYLSGVDKYEVNGTTYWWVSWDVSSTSSSNPSQIWRYDYDSSDDTNWTNKTVYNLGYYHSGYNIQGFTWWEDDYGNKYIICPVHEGASPATVDVYKWNGSGFDNYAQYDYIENPDGDISSQGVCRDFSGDNTYLYFASRQGPAGNPILKGEMVQSSGYAVYWIKLPSSAPSSIYLFAGNYSASQYSDGDETFLLFDDFEGASLDTDKWNIDQGNAWVENGYLRLDKESGVRNYVVSKTYSGSNYAIRARARSRPDGSYIDVRLTARYTDVNNHYLYTVPDSRVYKRISGSFTLIQDVEDAFSDTNWHVIEWRLYSNSQETYVDGTKYNDLTDNEYTSGKIGVSGDGRYHKSPDVDWILVRKYIEPEPTWSSFGPWEEIVKRVRHPITHLDKGPHPRSRMGFFPKLCL